MLSDSVRSSDIKVMQYFKTMDDKIESITTDMIKLLGSRVADELGID